MRTVQKQEPEDAEVELVLPENEYGFEVSPDEVKDLMKDLDEVCSNFSSPGSVDICFSMENPYKVWNFPTTETNLPALNKRLGQLEEEWS